MCLRHGVDFLFGRVLTKEIRIFGQLEYYHGDMPFSLKLFHIQKATFRENPDRYRSELMQQLAGS